MPTAFDENSTIQSVTASGGPPRARIANANAAFAIFDRVKKDMRPIAYQRSRVKGQQDGKAPFSTAKRQENGTAWQSNVNMRRARHNVQQSIASLWTMLMTTRTLVDLSLSDAKLKDNQEPSINPGDILAEEFTRILRDDIDFVYGVMLQLHEIETYGGGPCMFRNEWIWRPDVLRNANVFFPAKTKSQPGMQEFMAIRDEKSVISLFEDVILNENAEDEGWDVEAVKRVLIATYRKGQTSPTTDAYTLSEWETVEQRLTNGDDASDKQFDGIVLIHELVVEGDGKVSHVIISENVLEDTSKSSDTGGGREMLFKGDRRWNSVMEVFQNLLSGVGDGFLKSVKGRAFDLFPTEDMFNRTFNGAMDGVNLGTGLLLQPKTGEDAQSLGLIRRGPVTVLPANVDVIQSSFQPPIDRAITALGMISSIEQNNTGVSRIQPETGVARRPVSARQVEHEAQTEATFQSNDAAWLYVQWEALLREIFRRLINSDYPDTAIGYEQHKLFMQRCKDRGVSTSLLKFDVWTIRAKRAIGMGSASIARRDTNDLLSISGGFDERGRINARRDWIEVRFGFEAVDRYMPIEDRNSIVTHAHSSAALENNDFAQGQSVPAGTDEPHEIHLVSHIERLVADLQRFSAGQMPPDAMFAQLQAAMPHIQQHIVFMSRDPNRKGKADEFAETLQQIAQQAQVVAKQVEQLQKQKQEQAEAQRQALIEQVKAEADKEHQLKVQEVMLEHERELLKVQGLNQTRFAKLEASIATQVRKAVADENRKNFVAQQEQNRKNRETANNTQGGTGE